MRVVGLTSGRATARIIGLTAWWVIGSRTAVGRVGDRVIRVRVAGEVVGIHDGVGVLGSVPLGIGVIGVGAQVDGVGAWAVCVRVRVRAPLPAPLLATLPGALLPPPAGAKVPSGGGRLRLIIA